MKTLIISLFLAICFVGCEKNESEVHHYKINVTTSKITYLKYETEQDEVIIIDSNNPYAWLRSYDKELDAEYLELTINDWGSGDTRAHLTIYKDDIKIVDEDQGVNEPRIYKL